MILLLHIVRITSPEHQQMAVQYTSHVISVCITWQRNWTAIGWRDHCLSYRVSHKTSQYKDGLWSLNYNPVFHARIKDYFKYQRRPPSRLAIVMFRVILCISLNENFSSFLIRSKKLVYFLQIDFKLNQIYLYFLFWSGFFYTTLDFKLNSPFFPV